MTASNFLRPGATLGKSRSVKICANLGTGPSNGTLGPIHPSVASYHRAKRDAPSDKARGVYVLIVRGPDGRPRSERFNDVAAYRARLLALNGGTTGERSEHGSISIEEIAGLLDT